MKPYAAIATMLVMFAFATGTQGQQCYTPVPSWQGSYTLSASAKKVLCEGGDAVCNITNSTAAKTNLTENGLSGSCTGQEWYNGNDTVIQQEVSATYTSTSPCGIANWKTMTATGNGSGFSLSHQFGIFSTGKYFYEVISGEDTTVTTIACDGTKLTTTGDASLSPDSNWPISITLPTSVEPLPVTEPEPFSALSGTVDAVIPWTFSFKLIPNVLVDHDCKKSGGQGSPVGSSIGCQNQSLGEEVAITGTGFSLHYESSRALGAGGNAAASADAAMLGGWTLSVHHAYDPNTNTLFFGDGSQRNGYQLGTPVSLFLNLLITSEDGSEVYVFSLLTGLHVQTLRPLTGALLYQFGYDANGNLITVTDANGNVTTIQRNAVGQPVAIVSPYGQTTTLAVDSQGFLSRITDPLGKSGSFVNSPTGLLTSRTDRNGNTYSYTYDANGRLAKDADPLGGFIAASRSYANTGFGYTVAQTTSMGRTSSYQTTLNLPWFQDGTKPQSEQHTNTWPNGLRASSSNGFANGQLSNGVSLPDGSGASQTLGPDPIWGLQLPVNLSETLTQGNLTWKLSGSRTASLSTTGNPFSVTTESDTQTVNGRTYTLTYTGSTRTYVHTTPAGRTVATRLDALERLSSLQVGGLTATKLAYDTHGRLASITEGTRKTTLDYNAEGFLDSVTDPLNLTTRFTYDADGQVLTATLPDGRFIAYAYDANGNVTSVTPPGKAAHELAYNAVDLLEPYSPPTITGGGATTYAYNLDRDLTGITRPDGQTISYAYDSAGRLSSFTTPTGRTTYTYNTTTGNVSGESDGTEKIAYTYNGPLPIQTTWSGTVAGNIGRAYNNDFWVASQTINGANTVAFSYDNDGMTAKAGSLSIQRRAKDGLIAGTTLGVTSDTRTYNTFGELTGYTAAASGTTIYSVQYTRDADARVTAKTETINGTTKHYTYSYDLDGRLTSAIKNGAANTYTYDSNSNRLSGTTPAGTANGTYDAQDRLLSYGKASYAYTANGEMTSQSIGTQVTGYKYDLMGNLTAVTLPGGAKISYVIDPENRRVGKRLNGVLQAGFLYDDDDDTIVAQLNGSNQLVSQFVYATGPAPDYMVTGGATYRIFTDQLGSPVLVVNSATGAITQEITYDEFGNVLSDTNPGFQPFGFAGGLYDRDTKLVRFGARDYNPALGRWMAKDYLLFEGGDTNLYGYVLADPINLVDRGGADDKQATQGGPSNGDTITKWIVESSETIQKVHKGYGKCKKVIKYGNAIRKGVDGVKDLGKGEIKGFVKNNTGALNESKHLLEETNKSTPSVEKYSNPVKNFYNQSSNALAGKPCPNCKDQPKPPDPKPVHLPTPRSPLDEFDPTVPVKNPTTDDY